MEHYNFIATNIRIELNNMKVEDFVDSFPDFQTVALNSDKQLEDLLELIGVKQIVQVKTTNSHFTNYWDLSNYSLPELNEKEFDKLYNRWLDISKQESDMNKYGSLIFLWGKSKEWNELKYKYVIKEEKGT